jgi:ATP-dependent exoDNAse (exonuclease V) alpha subunit
MIMAINEDNPKGIEYTLTAGMPVISMVTREKLNVVNNEEFTIQKITDSTIFLINEYHEEAVEIPLEKFGDAFDLAFATTIHKSQGSTYDVPHVVHEWHHFGFDEIDVCRMRTTAVTRTTAWEHLMIA